MIGIDKIAYNSKLSNTSVSQKVVFCLVPLIICLVSNSIIICIITIFSMAFFNIFVGGIKFKNYLKFLLIPFGFVVISIITIVFNKLSPFEQNKIFSLSFFNNSYGITENSLLIGIKLFLKSIASVSCLFLLSLNTPMNNLFNFFRKLRLPKLFVDIMELIYRFIFILFFEAKSIFIAQLARLGYKNFKSSIVSLANLVSLIFLSSLNRADNINISLESRCYDGHFGYLAEQEVFSKSVAIFGFILSSVLLTLLILKV